MVAHSSPYESCQRAEYSVATGTVRDRQGSHNNACLSSLSLLQREACLVEKSISSKPDHVVRELVSLLILSTVLFIDLFA